MKDTYIVDLINEKIVEMKYVIDEYEKSILYNQKIIANNTPSFGKSNYDCDEISKEVETVRVNIYRNMIDTILKPTISNYIVLRDFCINEFGE